MTEQVDDQWQQLQQHYWQNWLKLLQQMQQMQSAESATQQSVSHWSETLELWWQALSPKIALDQRELLRKFVNQGKSYFRLNGEFLKAFTRLQQFDKNTSLKDWEDALEEGFQTLENTFSAMQQNPQQALDLWALPIDNWQRTLSSLSTLPSDSMEGFKADIMAGRDQVQDQINTLLSVPGVGYSREWQEQLQQGSQHWLDYQKSYQDYLLQFSHIGERAVKLLKQTFLETKKPINDLRSLYNLWVDCGESAYAEHVYSEQFAQSQAQLLNSLMRWKRHEQRMIDGMLDTFHMPTRRELNTMNQRIQQLRRENRRLQSKLDIGELLQQVANLQDTVSELQSAIPNKPRRNS